MMYELKPITDDASYEEALEAIEDLMEKDHAEGSAEYHLLDALVTLVEHYEELHYGDLGEGLDPVELIKAFMLDNEYSSKDFATVLGSASRASEILNYKRGLALTHIRNLNEKWHLPVEALIKDYPLKRA